VTVWRISNHPTLDGTGGLRASGRWHTRGRRIVYCAPNPATALLEILVHAEIDLEDLPVTYKYLEIDVPESVSREVLDPSALGAGWSARFEDTRTIGEEWLQSRRTALLLVPSAIVPVTTNIVLNPAHPAAAGFKIVRTHMQRMDPRLIMG
jgi:RES domain-containing protein